MGAARRFSLSTDAGITLTVDRPVGDEQPTRKAPRTRQPPTTRDLRQAPENTQSNLVIFVEGRGFFGGRERW